MPSISREKLYEKVWSKPMTTVAKDFGITSTALKKTCKKHQIPTPERGYWARLQHGKPVRKQPLPKLRDERLVNVNVAAYVRPIPEVVQKAKAAVESQLEDLSKTNLALAQEPLVEPPILSPTRKALSKARADSLGYIAVNGPGILPVKIAPGSTDRTLQILARFLALSHSQGHTAKFTQTGLVLVVNAEPIEFAVQERATKDPHEPTDAELKKQSADDRWGRSRTIIRKYDHKPSGSLAIQIQSNSYSGLRRSYGERKGRKLEDRLPDILAAFVEHAAFAKQQRLEAEERNRRWKEAEEQRKREQEFNSREQRRMLFVDAVHDQLLLRDKLSRVLSHLEHADADESNPVQEIRVWLRERIFEVDALLNSTFLELSARSAKISFRDTEPSDPAVEGGYWMRDKPDLQFWSIDEEKDYATSISRLQWKNRNQDGST